MSKHLQNDLNEVENALSEQAAAVEQMVQAAYDGLCNRCLGTAAKVIASEARIDESEVMIEDKCLEMLALYQPVAIDLRRIAAAIKINSDLERIGDLALSLAERTEDLAKHPEVEVPASLELMVEKALAMLRDAHQAFITIDESLAVRVRERDDEVDDLNREIIDGIAARIEADPQQTAGLLHVFSASRIIERIADHATNIAEDVLYLSQGEIARHRIVALSA